VHGGCQRDKGEGDPNPRRATKKWWGHLKNLRSIRAGLSATAIKTPREVFAAVAVQASAVSPPEWLAVEVGNGDTHDVQLNRPTGQWPLAFARYAFDVAHAHAIHVCCLANRHPVFQAPGAALGATPVLACVAFLSCAAGTV
jgi:hypothetical protein